MRWGLVVIFGVLDLIVGGLGLEEQGALVIFPDAENDEGDGGGGGPEFGVARDFRFRFPAEELSGDEEGEEGPASERNDFNPDARDGLAEKCGALKSPN